MSEIEVYLASPGFLDRLARALCRGIVCSHRAARNRPCEIHKDEARWIQEQLIKR